MTEALDYEPEGRTRKFKMYEKPLYATQKLFIFYINYGLQGTSFALNFFRDFIFSFNFYYSRGIKLLLCFMGWRPRTRN